MEEMLKGILENPDTMKQIMGLISSFKGAEEQAGNTEGNSSISLPFGLDNPETLLKLGNAFGKIANDNDPRINLIVAIKPYLNNNRLLGAERAMQILKLSKMSSVLEELKIL